MIDFRLLFESVIPPLFISMLLYVISPQMLPLEGHLFMIVAFTLVVYSFVERIRIDQQEEMKRLREKYVDGEIDVREFEDGIERQVEKET